MKPRRWAAAVAVVLLAGGITTWVVIEQRDDACEAYAVRVDRLETRLEAEAATAAEESRAILRIAREQPEGCDLFVPKLLAPARM